jgi:3',5'-cyclic AMP phosphodiesterase CpdA
MRLAWLTDIHFNFLRPSQLAAFHDEVAATEPDAVLIGGDIAEAHDLVDHLERCADRWRCPIYFVLGNHDAYGGSIAGIRAAAAELTARSPWLRYLPAAGPVDLGGGTVLVGHDGWGDARLGAPETSPVMLNDWVHIAELEGLGRAARNARLRALGDEAAAYLAREVPPLLDRFEELVVLTHVPPWREACWHEGRISDDNWLPWFTCARTGEVLREAMEARPDRRMTVLCGHTHGAGEAAIVPNLRVVTGGAEYGEPRVERVLEVGSAAGQRATG